MATSTDKNRCAICGKEKATLRCGGCSKDFCFSHVADHRQELSKQMDEVEVTRDLFRQTLTEQTSQPQKHPLMKQIDTWERDSINKIRQMAEEARQLLFQHTTGHIEELEAQLNKLTIQLRQSREDDDFFETDLSRWKSELARLTEALNKPPNISVREDSTSLVTKIFVDVSTAQSCTPNIRTSARWKQNGTTVAGDNGRGCELNQLNSPWNIHIDDDQTIYIADCNNNRIMKWKCGETNGQLAAGGNGQGNGNDQLNRPTAVAIDKESDSLIICDNGNQRVVRWPRRNGANRQTIISDVNSWGLTIDNRGYVYVSDYENHEVRRWRTGDVTGTVVAGGNGQGNRLDQLNWPTHLFVDQDHCIYVSDTSNNRVMKWNKGAKEGIVVAGGQGQGNGLAQLSSPRGVAVDQFGTVYVAEYNNHRIMRWSKGATQGSVVIGGNGHGGQANQLAHPMGLSLGQEGNFYVVDYLNNRIQKFSIDPSSSS